MALLYLNSVSNSINSYLNYLTIAYYKFSAKILSLNHLNYSYHSLYVMFCAIWYHLHNLKNVKNTHGGVILAMKLQSSAGRFTKSITPPWVFLTFFK